LVVWASERDRPIAAFGAVNQDLPATFVNLSMVVPAQQDRVGEVGSTSVLPGHDVMGIGMHRGARTIGESTAAIADRQGMTLSGGE